jgi:S1-C subfamily serine protease
MNTAIATNTGDNSGIGFAIPVSAIKRVVPQLIENGRVIRPTLGIAKTFETNSGLLGIHVLVENGPAEKAGLQGAYWAERVRYNGGTLIRQYTDPRHADFILAIDGQPVKTFDELLGELEKHKPGDQVILTVLRRDKQMNVAVTLEAE